MLISSGGVRLFTLHSYNTIKITDSTFKGSTDFATRTVVSAKDNVIANFVRCKFTGSLRIIDTRQSIVTFTKCQFINATSEDSLISLSGNSHLQITDSSIMYLEQNEHPFVEISMDSLITMTGCLYFKSHRKSNFLVGNYSTVRIYNSFFVNNTGDGDYAAILSVVFGKLDVQNTTFTQNTGRQSIILSAYKSDIELRDTNITLNNYIKEELESAVIISARLSSLSFLNCLMLNNTMTFSISVYSQPEHYYWMIRCTIADISGGINLNGMSDVLFEESLFINSGSFYFFSRDADAVVRISKSVISDDRTSFHLRNVRDLELLTYKSTFRSRNITLNSHEDGFQLSALFGTQRHSFFPSRRPPFSIAYIFQWETEYASCKYLIYHQFKFVMYLH